MNFAYQARRNVALLVLIGLAVRVVIPAGYMPAPLAEGGPFVLCPGGLSGASYFIEDGAAAHGHHDGRDDHPGAHESGAAEFCPFGAVFGASAATVEPTGGILPPASPPATAVSAAPTQAPAVRPFRARAPPRYVSRDRT